MTSKLQAQCLTCDLKNNNKKYLALARLTAYKFPNTHQRSQIQTAAEILTDRSENEQGQYIYNNKSLLLKLTQGERVTQREADNIRTQKKFIRARFLVLPSALLTQRGRVNAWLRRRDSTHRKRHEQRELRFACHAHNLASLTGFAFCASSPPDRT